MAYVYWIHLPEHTIAEGYIGVTVDIRRRWNEHKNRRNSSCVHLANAINKHGEALVYEVIFQGPEEGCYQLEEYFRPSTAIGWNIVNGGSRPAPSYKQKLASSIANKSRVRTQLERDRLSKSRIGKYAKGNAPKAKHVMCLLTGETFTSGVEAAEWCNLKNATSILNYCNGHKNIKSAGKHPYTKEPLTWKFI